MPAEYDGNSNTIVWRLARVERTTDDLEKTKANKEDLHQIAMEVRGLRRVLIGFMATIGGSAVLFSFTILEILAHH